MSANSLTTAIVNHLKLLGFEAWRQNNGAIADPKQSLKAGKAIYRKNPNHKKGIPDVLGFCKKTARFVAIEVKVGKDKLSPEQIQFLAAVNRAGGIAFEARSLDEFMQIIKDYLK